MSSTRVIPVKSSAQVGETSPTSSNIVAIPVVRATLHLGFLFYIVTVL